MRHLLFLILSLSLGCQQLSSTMVQSKKLPPRVTDPSSIRFPDSLEPPPVPKVERKDK